MVRCSTRSVRDPVMPARRPGFGGVGESIGNLAKGGAAGATAATQHHAAGDGTTMHSVKITDSRSMNPDYPAMLRINELKLPLDHDEAALRAAVLARLGVDSAELVSFTVFKRSYDARKKSAIVLIYAIDAALRDEAAVLARLGTTPT
jgi:hypothetical protein